MAQDRVLGEQVDIIDLTGDIAVDATAIGNIATGLANDASAATNLAAGLDHADIGTGIGSNSHATIDSHIADSAIHFSTITGLSDVNAPAPTDRDVLVWQIGSSTWIPGIRVENPMISNLDVDAFSVITAAETTNIDTNTITLQGGANNYAGGGRIAGSINLYAGVGTLGNYGGAINLVAGSTVATTGSNITIKGGATTNAAASTAGQVEIFGGDGFSVSTGGDVKITGGSSQQSTGGDVNIDGGTSGVTTGIGGGDINIKGGENLNSTGSYPGGDVNIEGGATPSTGGQSGSVNIRPGGKAGNLAGSVNVYPATVNADEASINLWSDTSNNYIALKAPVFVGSPTVNRTWVLPQDDPATVNGQFLTTDASGNLSFDIPPPEYIPLGIVADTTTSYTLVLTDGGNMVTMNNAAANTLTIPTNASVAFVIGTEIVISQTGAGTTTISGGVGSPPAVTVNSAGALTSLAEQFSTATLVKLGTDTWLLTGDTA